MAKLTKAQRRDLEQARYDLKRGIDYIMSPQVAVCRVSRDAADSLTFRRPPISDEVARHILSAEQRARGHYALTEVTKEIGSNLTGVFAALRAIERMLEISTD